MKWWQCNIHVLSEWKTRRLGQWQFKVGYTYFRCQGVTFEGFMAECSCMLWHNRMSIPPPFNHGPFDWTMLYSDLSYVQRELFPPTLAPTLVPIMSCGVCAKGRLVQRPECRKETIVWQTTSINFDVTRCKGCVSASARNQVVLEWSEMWVRQPVWLQYRWPSFDSADLGMIIPLTWRQWQWMVYIDVQLSYIITVDVFVSCFVIINWTISRRQNMENSHSRIS